MSRREARDSDSKRHRSKLDREPSPKRSRRDGKPVAERVLSKNDLVGKDSGDRDQQKLRPRLVDAVPLEVNLAPESKNGAADKKHNGNHQGTKRSLTDATKEPRSKSYHQHDERANAGDTYGRAVKERGWWRDARDQPNNRRTEEKSAHAKGNRDGVWRHDRFHESEADRPPSVKKRPAFSETKVQPIESENPKKTTMELEKDRKREDRGWNSQHWDRQIRDKNPERHGFPMRDRYGRNGGGGGGGDGFNRVRGRQDFRGMKEEKKWEHDLFNEANKSPIRRNEEEQIAKIEALLGS